MCSEGTWVDGCGGDVWQNSDSRANVAHDMKLPAWTEASLFIVLSISFSPPIFLSSISSLPLCVGDLLNRLMYDDVNSRGCVVH